MDKEREDEMEKLMKAGADMLTFPFLLAAMFLPKDEMDKIYNKVKEKLKEEKEKPPGKETPLPRILINKDIFSKHYKYKRISFFFFFALKGYFQGLDEYF